MAFKGSAKRADISVDERFYDEFTSDEDSYQEKRHCSSPRTKVNDDSSSLIISSDNDSDAKEYSNSLESDDGVAGTSNSNPKCKKTFRRRHIVESSDEEDESSGNKSAPEISDDEDAPVNDGPPEISEDEDIYPAVGGSAVSYDQGSVSSDSSAVNDSAGKFKKEKYQVDKSPKLPVSNDDSVVVLSDNEAIKPSGSSGSVHPKNIEPDRQLELIKAKSFYEDELIKESAKLKTLEATAKSSNLSNLPDKGVSLISSLKKQAKVVAKLKEQIQLLNSNIVHTDISPGKEDAPNPSHAQPKIPNIVDLTKDYVDLSEMGKRALATHHAHQSMTVQTLEKLHKFLKTSAEEDTVEDPAGLKVSLLPHQKVALAWLLKRETEFPPGGILADDMGLGKTLTMISLIVKDMEGGPSANKDDSGSEVDSPYSVKRKYPEGKTLVICPSSVLGQWASEINSKVRGGILSYYTHHGPKREKWPNRLCRFDVVITSYSILQNENKDEPGPLLNVHWKRVILDEGHVIRNYKSKTAQAIFLLRARRRWVLSGTPIHNKQEDFFSLLKFLRCKPFDDIVVWKKMVDNRTKSGAERLHLLTKSILLRRTKVEIQESGGLKDLKPKEFNTIQVTLDKEEMEIYKRIAHLSSALLAQYIAERAEKENLITGGVNIRRRGENPFENHPELGRLYSKMLTMNGGVKTHHILVLLLRLRQACCHPSLVTSMIAKEDVDGLEDDEGNDFNLIDQMMNMSIVEPTNEPVEETVKKAISADDPIFRKDRCSSKMRAIIDCLTQITVENESDKVIVVSQWTSVLDILRTFLKDMGIKSVSLNGTIPVKERPAIIDDFNNSKYGPKILLLSLTAGGTGLNLVGANHLLLIDLHWNPQLEAQACDRIYRVGQKKTVHVYKFLCKDTIEERILKVQNTKLEVSQGILTGSAKIQSSKLTLQDLKLLFDIKQ